MDKAKKALTNTFGFDTFRPLQEKIIKNALLNYDQVVLMPTGGGKSLCYQIPAMVKKGVALVVSPLIALMEDQVANLNGLGIEAAFYNSTLNAEAAKNTLRQLHQDAYDLFYVSPERLLSNHFLERLSTLPINLIAIDEAHCISQWGHDFRKEYAQLGLLKNHFPGVPLMALTATADKQTLNDITQQLAIKPITHIASFNRSNLNYYVLDKQKPLKQLSTFLHQHENQAGIIYCTTRKSVEKLCEQLKALNYKALPYHAGLSYEQRRTAQFAFQHDEIHIIVATIAFGMGIDKSNVRFIVHYDLPKSIENYYQETGRAGRDGLTADTLLLYSLADSAKLHAFIAQSNNPQQQRIESHKLNAMIALAESQVCRRRVLLNYFNESFEENCGHCDVCIHPPLSYDATVDAQKILSCIYRLGQNYGVIYTIDVLRGAKTEKILSSKHERLPTYGLCKHLSQEELKNIIYQLIHLGFCLQDIENFNVLKLTEKARPLLKGDIRLTLARPRTRIHGQKKAGKAIQKNIKHDNSLFELLRQLRKRLADEEGKPPFMVFSDATLVEMAAFMPQDESSLLAINGVGQHKLKHYGIDFIDCIKHYNPRNTIEA